MPKPSELLNRNIFRDLKHFVFLKKGLTKKPKDSLATTSDLFPIRIGEEWSTQFELLNIGGLIQGFSAGSAAEVSLYLFDAKGEVLDTIILSVKEFSRNSILIPPKFEKFANAASFAIFHKPIEQLKTTGSILAERGYTGYEYKRKGLRGYVHGNLDALALDRNGNLMCIGNRGFFRRSYLVQHVLRGPAKYEFFLTNPTIKETIVQMKVRGRNSWKEESRAAIRSRGTHSFSLSLNCHETKVVKFVSHLYMARPVVFRTTENSMDVFHG